MDYSSRVESHTEKCAEEISGTSGNPSQLTIHSGGYSKSVDFRLPHFFRFRENGMIKMSNFNSQVLNLKLRELKLVHANISGIRDFELCYCVKGFGKRLISTWLRSPATYLKSTCFIYSDLTSKSDQFLPTISDTISCDIDNLYAYKMLDFCGFTAGEDFVLYVANSFWGNRSIVKLLPMNVNRRAVQLDEMWEYMYAERLWSCAWNSFNYRFVLGADKSFYLHDYSNPSEKIELPEGTPISMDFNACGNLVFCGLDNGELTCFDLRSEHRVPTLRMPLCKTLSYVKPLSDERKILTSGFDNSLLNVDLRALKPVFEYPDHRSLCSKLPVTLDESLNILCAPGEDNITRFWSLKDGKLLHTLPVNTRGWKGQVHSLFQADGNRMYVHVLFKNIILTYEAIDDGVEFHYVLQIRKNF